jgi:hypothetical protein
MTVRPGWAPFLRPGVRVVVRYCIDPASAPHGEHRTDALGEVLEADADTVTIGTKRGPDRVQRSCIRAARPVPPPPTRRHPAPDPDAPWLDVP